MMAAPAYLQLYLDHQKVGCGWRAYLVLRVGRKWARIICTETADTLSVDAKLLRTGKPLDLKRSRLARRLRLVARSYEKDKSAGVRQALSMLTPKTARQKGTSGIGPAVTGDCNHGQPA